MSTGASSSGADCASSGADCASSGAGSASSGAGSASSGVSAPSVGVSPSRPVDIRGVVGGSSRPLFSVSEGELADAAGASRLGESPTAGTQTTPSLERRSPPNQEGLPSAAAAVVSGCGPSSSGRLSYEWDTDTVSPWPAPREDVEGSAAVGRTRSVSLPETSLRSARILTVGRQLRAMGNLYDALNMRQMMAPSQPVIRPSSYPRVAQAKRHKEAMLSRTRATPSPGDSPGPHPPRGAAVYDMWESWWEEQRGAAAAGEPGPGLRPESGETHTERKDT